MHVQKAVTALDKFLPEFTEQNDRLIQPWTAQYIDEEVLARSGYLELDHKNTKKFKRDLDITTGFLNNKGHATKLRYLDKLNACKSAIEADFNATKLDINMDIRDLATPQNNTKM